MLATMINVRSRPRHPQPPAERSLWLSAHRDSYYFRNVSLWAWFLRCCFTTRDDMWLVLARSFVLLGLQSVFA